MSNPIPILDPHPRPRALQKTIKYIVLFIVQTTISLFNVIQQCTPPLFFLPMFICLFTNIHSIYFSYNIMLFIYFDKYTKYLYLLLQHVLLLLPFQPTKQYVFR